MDSEIKALGEKYGIPTEFSSYLVVEPGMNVRRALVAGTRADVGAGAVMPAVAGNGAPASAPAPTAAEARFEMSRQAAAQRDAKSIAALDSMSAAPGMRQVGTRQFVQQGKVWTDQRYVPSQKTLQVKAFSPLYFELLNKLPELKEALALGDEVLVAGKDIAIQVGSIGLEQMSPVQLSVLIRAWQ